MSKSILFGNKVVKLPGTYARIVSGIVSDSPKTTYGNILLIDAGAGVGFNSAKGIGDDRGKECIYTLTEEEANFYLKGGPLSPVVSALFNPAKGVKGISNLILIKASVSTKASISTLSLFGGAITASKVETVEEGTACNSVILNSVLTRGYQLKTVYDSSSYKGYIEIWAGSYQGSNQKGYLISSPELVSPPVLVYRSKKFMRAQELYNYLSTSNDLKSLITFENLTLVEDTYTTKAGASYNFTGGTDSYSTSLDNVFNNIADTDYSCMIILEANGTQTFLDKAKEHLINDAKGIKNLATFAGDFLDAIDLAQTLDFDGATCYSGISKKTSKSSPTGFIIQDDMVTMAYLVGRIYGLSPEISGTFKNVGIDGLVSEPSDKMMEDLLEAGVIVPNYDGDLDAFVISQAVTTLQKNDVYINEEDCSTYSLQAKRILAQVVKVLQKNSKIDFYGGKTNANKGTLSNAYLTSWTNSQLEKLIVNQNKTEANYLLRGTTHSVTYDADSLSATIKFELVLNSEIAKVFLIGTVLSA